MSKAMEDIEIIDFSSIKKSEKKPKVGKKNAEKNNEQATIEIKEKKI